MALVKTLFGALRADSLPDFSGTATGDDSDIFITSSPGNYYHFTGSFTYDSFGRPSGTITNVELVVNNRVNFTVQGLSQAAAPLFQSETIEQVLAQVLGGDDRLYGRNLDDQIVGGPGDDRLFGKEGNDTLLGDIGIDTLRGEQGNDVLVGGVGADRLYGGTQADLFVYNAIEDSTNGNAGRDRIYDFNSSEGDRIDLSAINAVKGSSTDAAFSVVEAFTNVAGQLTISAVQGGFRVAGDTDGNGRADFGITVMTEGPLTGSDFFL